MMLLIYKKARFFLLSFLASAAIAAPEKNLADLLFQLYRKGELGLQEDIWSVLLKEIGTDELLKKKAQNDIELLMAFSNLQKDFAVEKASTAVQKEIDRVFKTFMEALSLADLKAAIIQDYDLKHVSHSENPQKETDSSGPEEKKTDSAGGIEQCVQGLEALSLGQMEEAPQMLNLEKKHSPGSKKKKKGDQSPQKESAESSVEKVSKTEKEKGQSANVGFQDVRKTAASYFEDDSKQKSHEKICLAPKKVDFFSPFDIPKETPLFKESISSDINTNLSYIVGLSEFLRKSPNFLTCCLNIGLLDSLTLDLGGVKKDAVIGQDTLSNQYSLNIEKYEETKKVIFFIVSEYFSFEEGGKCPLIHERAALMEEIGQKLKKIDFQPYDVSAKKMSLIISDLLIEWEKDEQILNRKQDEIADKEKLEEEVTFRFFFGEKNIKRKHLREYVLSLVLFIYLNADVCLKIAEKAEMFLKTDPQPIALRDLFVFDIPDPDLAEEINHAIPILIDLINLIQKNDVYAMNAKQELEKYMLDFVLLADRITLEIFVKDIYVHFWKKNFYNKEYKVKLPLRIACCEGLSWTLSPSCGIDLLQIYVDCIPEKRNTETGVFQSLDSSWLQLKQELGVLCNQNALTLSEKIMLMQTKGLFENIALKYDAYNALLSPDLEVSVSDKLKKAMEIETDILAIKHADFKNKLILLTNIDKDIVRFQNKIEKKKKKKDPKVLLQQEEIEIRFEEKRYNIKRGDLDRYMAETFYEFYCSGLCFGAPLPFVVGDPLLHKRVAEDYDILKDLINPLSQDSVQRFDLLQNPILKEKMIEHRKFALENPQKMDI